MKYRKRLMAFSVIGMICAYYFIGRYYYLGAAKSAFPQMPIEEKGWYVPWPFGPPSVIGFLEPDDPIYNHRASINRSSQRMHLSIMDSDGMFELRPE